MNLQHQPILPTVLVEAWNEELARDKKFKEAVQRRLKEKNLRGEGQKLKKASVIERLMMEP